VEDHGYYEGICGEVQGFAYGACPITSINVPLTFAWTADKNCHNKQYNHDDNKNNVGNEEDTWRDQEQRQEQDLELDSESAWWLVR